MAGKVHFARGRFHASRAPTNGGIMPEEVEELRGEINQALPGIVVNVEGLCILRDAIALARARVKEHADRATRQDSIAQLESMMRCTDDALVLGLRACDLRTLALVNGAQMELMADVISATGCFVDVEVTEHRLIVVAETYSRPLLRFLARLKEYAIAIECFILDWMPADLGMRWQRGQEAEWIGIGDQHRQEAA